MPALESITPKPKRKRGARPSGVYEVDEVADLLGVEPCRVQRSLESDKMRADAFPNARRADDGSGRWLVPWPDVRRLLGPGEPRLYSVAVFADLIGFSVSYVHDLCTRGVVQHRLVLGEKRIPASQYYSLPPHRPEPVADRPRPSFFSGGSTHE